MTAPGRPFGWAYGVIRGIRNAGLAVLLVSGAAMAEPVTVAALGDSLTQGFGLPAEQGFVPVLEAWLEASGQDVELINAGVSGDTTAGGLSRVAWTLTPEVDALIVALGGNDLLRGLDPAVSRGNLDQILAFASERELPVLLVGIKAPANYGPEFKTAFDGMFPALSEKYGTLLYSSFLAPLTAELDQAEALQAYMQPDGIHPNAAGVKVIVDAMGPKVAELVDRASD